MNIDKEVFELWKEVSPESAYGSGLKEFAGCVWVPSHQNVRKALARIAFLKKHADPVAFKWLRSLERGLVFEEPQHAPSGVMGVFFEHLVMNAKEKDYLALAVQCLNVLAVQEHLWEKAWPIEMQIYSAQECSGGIALLETVKKLCKKNEAKEALTALQNRLKIWKEKTSDVKLKKGDFSEVFPLLKKKSKGLGRKSVYPNLLRDWYDYPESGEDIERLALGWIDEELQSFKASVNKLSKRYKCKASVEEINRALEVNQRIPLKKLVKTTQDLRKVLQRLADKEWVKITPKYDVRLIETPDYLVAFLPTAAMQPFGSLSSPFCISFITTDKSASPSTFLPGVMQTLIHEEYGHCVNFMNSYRCFSHPLRVTEILDSSLSTPITEGISFFRELESLRTLRRIAQDPNDDVERNVVKQVEKFCEFADFVDGLEFEVMQWRMVRFLRAVCDSRVNRERQSYPAFIEWAHKKTGLSKKLVFDQTFHFLERPGYAPCYSIFGQRLRDLQAKAMKKGVSQVEFNTFVASSGFAARTVFESKLRKEFRL
ncbi:hypothetical protein J4219_01105 [Candidatus Woesearchaeota archaeon]|nr:hypothetical protein [Candidatus Woesearchaeota archaeon]